MARNEFSQGIEKVIDALGGFMISFCYAVSHRPSSFDASPLSGCGDCVHDDCPLGQIIISRPRAAHAKNLKFL
ncbi:MAG TPA: hypothetical protein DIS76_07760 [Rhodospirillaceae bacterium]|nr:hypothetical protein [Rhodospirillaceae bacterium]